jgi:hypothetical protein
MRAKFIAVYTVVVLVVGVLAFALTRTTLGTGAPTADASRALSSAKAELQLEALKLERWLERQAADPKIREPFNAGTPQARGDQATAVANGIRDAAAANPEFAPLSPSLSVLVDPKGVVVGRNGTALMRGDDLGTIYPPLKSALAKGTTGSDVWVNKDRNEQFLVSYAPIRDNGQVIGGVVVGTALNDGRLADASNRTSGGLLLFGVRKGNELELLARSSQSAAPEVVAAVASSPAKDGALSTLVSGQAVDLAGLPPSFSARSGPLDGYGDGKRAVLISVARAEAPATGKLLWPFLGAIALGIVLVVIGSYFLDQYISRPIQEMEEGLLAVMNGRTDLRFEIEHAELGGLVFRLNSLLNQLLGVQEEEPTDEEGHPTTHRPTGKDFVEALAVDETMAEKASGGSEAKALREEADDAYYARVFDEYIRAKKQVGDPIDHITREAFIGRIMQSERTMAQKHGKPVRYKVEVRGKEVVLLAVPLA